MISVNNREVILRTTFEVRGLAAREMRRGFIFA
jgi:hypothetical protein